MKTRIKTGKVSLIVFMAVMAVCVAGVAIWCYAVGYQVKEHRQGGSVTWVEYNGSTYYRMDGLTGEYCNFITDHRVSYKPRPVLSRAYYTLKNDRTATICTVPPFGITFCTRGFPLGAWIK